MNEKGFTAAISERVSHTKPDLVRLEPAGQLERLERLFKVARGAAGSSRVELYQRVALRLRARAGERESASTHRP